MSVPVRAAVGFAVLRGFMLAVLTVPWLAQKVRRAEAAPAERSLAWMAASRSILLGVALLSLSFGARREALAWVLLGDGALQLFDALHALSLRTRRLAVLPAILCLLDGGAGMTLMG
jgi:hypothetical protein